MCRARSLPMIEFVIRRVLATIPVLIGVSLISFLMVHLSGDPTDVILPVNATEEAREAFRKLHGLDRPLVAQYLDFLAKVVTGNFGNSIRFEQPAGQLVFERLGATAELAGAAMALSVLIGVPAGVIAAYFQNSVGDTAVRAVTLIGQALPNFYLAILLMIVFAVWLRVLPSGGRGTLAHLVLPSITLAAYLIALVARVTRSCMLDELRRDYIRTARAKGLGEGRVVWQHGLRNAFIPVITVIGLQVGLLMGGVVVIETIFAWPGIGRLAVQSIYARDLPVVQAIVFLSAVVFVLVNLVVDLLYAVFDPRIGYK